MNDASKAKLNKKAEDVANALGVAMAQWGVVENELYLFYAALCEAGPYPNPSAVVYESLIHLDTKLNAIEALVRFRITDEKQLAAWTRLSNRIRRKIKKVRNKLAHWRIWRDNEKQIAFLGPPLLRPAREIPDFGTSHGGAMFKDDLIEHARQFTQLADDIRDFLRNYTGMAR